MLSNIITSKIVAVLLGTTGVALFGQLTNLSNILLTTSIGAMNLGLTKYVSDADHDHAEQKKYISTAFSIVIILSAITTLCVLIFSNEITNIIFHNSELNNIVILLGFGCIFNTANYMVVAILNGKKDLKGFTKVSLINTAVGISIVPLLTYFFNLQGALIGYVLIAPVAFFFSILLFYNSIVPNIEIKSFWNKKIALQLFSVSSMAILSAIFLPLSQIAIRNYLISNISTDAAGLWEGTNRISQVIYLLVASSLQIYYLTSFSNLNKLSEIRQSIFKIGKMVFPLIVVMLAVIYLCKDLVIHILFSSTFLKIRDIIGLQLLGDLFKNLSWLFLYALFVKKFTKIYLLLEVIFSISLILITFYCIDNYGLFGSTLGYCINNFIYFIVLLSLFYFGGKISNHDKASC